MPVKVLFAFLFLIFPLHLSAQVIYPPNTCRIEIPVEVPEEESTEESQLVVDFDSSLFKVSHLRLDWRGNIDLSKVQIRWPQVDFVDSRGEIFFRPSYYDLLREQLLIPFEFMKTESGNFEAPFWGFSRVKSFFTLLHSQESFSLDLFDSTGSLLDSVEVSLRGSDLAFRNMAHFCFPSQSQSYLEGVTRKQGVGLSWEHSYGVLEYENIQSFSQELFNRSFEGENTEDQLKTLLDLVSQIQGEQQSLESSRYADFLIKLDPLVSRLNVVQNSIENLQGERGVLASIDLKINKARQDIQNLESEIQGLQTDESQISDEIQTSSEEFSELSISLALIEAEMSSVRRQLDEASEKLQRLTTLSSHNLVGDWVTAPTVTNPVDQFTQVFDQVAAIELNEEQKQQVLKVGTIASQIEGKMEGLRGLHTTLMEQRRALLAIRSQITEAEGELRNQLDIMDILGGQYFGLNFESLNPLLQQEMAIQSDDIKVFEAQEFVASVRQSYEDYDEKLLEIGRELNQEELFSHLICSTASLKNDFMGSCLDPRHLDNQGRVEDYLSGLSSEDLERLGGWLGKHNNIFNQQNFIEEIVLEWAILVSLIPVDDLVQRWEAVLYARWKFFKARDLGFNEVTLLSLQEVLFQIRDEISLKQQQVAQSRAEIESLKNRYQVQSQTFERQEQLFFAETRAVYHQIISEVNQIQTDYLQCFSLETQPLNCSEALTTLSETLRSDQEMLGQEREQLLESLKSSYLSTFSYLTNTLEEARRRQREVISQRQDFIRTHNLREKQSLLETLRTQKRELTQELGNLMAQKQQQEELLESSTVIQSNHQKHLMRFLIERAELIEEVTPLETQLETYCGEVRELQNRWEELVEKSRKEFQLHDVQPRSLRQLQQRCQLAL